MHVSLQVSSFEDENPKGVMLFLHPLALWYANSDHKLLRRCDSHFAVRTACLDAWVKFLIYVQPTLDYIDIHQALQNKVIFDHSSN